MAPLRVLAVAMAVLVAALVLVSCGRIGEEASAEIVPAEEAVAAIEEGATVVDVRTPEEFDTGHLPDALNIDVMADDFEERIDDLDRASSYVVYCRSGSRAAAAVESMLEAGFTDVVNGGGYEDLVSAGAG